MHISDFLRILRARTYNIGNIGRHQNYIDKGKENYGTEIITKQKTRLWETIKQLRGQIGQAPLC